MFGENFPYVNFHDLNLDWILKTLKDIKSENETIETFIPQIQDIYTLIGQLQDLPDDMDDFEDEVNDQLQQFQAIINQAVNPLSNIICLTDSYGRDDEDTEKISWCTYLKNKLNLSNSNYMKIYAAGASFGDDDTTKNFYNIFVSGVSSMTSDQKAAVTDIIIEGGVNEWNEDNQLLKDNMRSLNTYIRTNFPNAKIHLFFCGWSKLATVRYASMGGATATHNLYNSMCNELKWNYVFNVSPMIITDSYIANDDTHPINSASREIADIIYEALMHGNTSVSFNKNIAFDISIITSSNTRTLGKIYFNGNEFVLNPTTFSCDTIGNLASGFTSTVKVGKITTLAVIGCDPSATYIISTPCKLGYKTSGSWHEIDVRASFRYESGDINLYLTNNGCFNPIPSPALSSIQDTYVLMPQVIIPIWD